MATIKELGKTIAQHPRGGQGKLAKDALQDFDLDAVWQEIVNFWETEGRSWRRQTFRNTGLDVMLIAATTIHDTPMVGFITGRDTRDCVERLFYMVHAGIEFWQMDKFG